MTSRKAASPSKTVLPISVTATQPVSPNIQYFQEIVIPVSVINRSRSKLLIEKIQLKFDGDAEPVYTDHECYLSLLPNRSGEEQIKVTPTPRFKAWTNQFRVRVYYRKENKSGIGSRRDWIHDGPPLPYVIIQPASAPLGQAFISFKQPEDRGLAKILATMAERAGFKPYLAENNPQFGTELWNRIERELHQSVVAFVIWTNRTGWGGGVKRELDLIIKTRKPHVLVIEQGVDLPEAYSQVFEYGQFDIQQPHACFENAVISMWRAITKVPGS